MTTARIPAPRTELAPLNLIAVERVRGLSQRAADYLLTLLAAHLMEHDTLDRATFLRLADEAEAIAS
jgi:hypothetical protein